jgi:hypothetical protein
MALGPPTCAKCMCAGWLDVSRKKNPWYCPICGEDPKEYIWGYSPHDQQLMNNRAFLFHHSPPIINDMIVEAKTTRPFMRVGEKEPNEHYRPWLEKIVGKQGVDWNWQLVPTCIDSLEISFADSNHAVLFELIWP